MSVGKIFKHAYIILAANIAMHKSPELKMEFPSTVHHFAHQLLAGNAKEKAVILKWLNDMPII
jgi:hypothetical protein